METLSKELETYDEIMNWLSGYYNNVYLEWHKYLAHMEPYMEQKEQELRDGEDDVDANFFDLSEHVQQRLMEREE